MRGFLVIVVVLALGALGCKENLPEKFEAGQTVALRGELGAGTECPVLIVKGDRRVSLSGDLGRFRTGDRVCVLGTVAAMSMCMAGEATIEIRSIAPEDSCR